MKKIIISILIILLCGCSTNMKGTTDGEKFKEEYESINDTLKSDGTSYIKMNIDSNNPMKYSSYEEVMDILDGTGIIYLGFKECPWCRTSLPVLLEVANELKVKTIYYFNALNIRDTKELKDGNIVTTKEGTKEYYNLVNKLYDYLGVYNGLNDETIKRIYFPTVIFVSNGEIKGLHVGTVSSQTNVNISLTEEQREELKTIYKNYMLEVVNTSCSGGC